MEGSNQKITGYIKIIKPTESVLLTGGNSLSLSRRRDEIVLDLTIRDKKNHYFYDDYNSKYFMPEPCTPCLDGRGIDQCCGQDLCDIDSGPITINSPPVRTPIFLPPPIIPPPLPPIPRPPVIPIPGFEDEGEQEEEEDTCPSNITRYGRLGDSCSEECCFCGNVEHCIEITSYKSGFIVRQCAPPESQLPDSCAGFNGCTCPTCDCDCDNDYNPNEYCYCPCSIPRREPSVEFKTCETKTVRACWSPSDGLEDDGRMKFTASDGTTAFLDFETSSFIPGNLGSGLQHTENITSEDPEVPGAFDSCPQDQASSISYGGIPCLLGCGYGEGFICEPLEDLLPETTTNGCQSGSTTYYQYACYGILTCPQGTHFSECIKVPRITYSWSKIELRDEGFGGKYNIPTPVPIGLPFGGPKYSPATDCQTRTSSSCGQESDGGLPEDYQTDFGGTLYPPSAG